MLVVVGLFLLAPSTLEHKAHLALHGLCAQRPSHSLRLGDQVLPFDARMTGIYGGFLVTGCYLVARRRLRAWRLPERTVLVGLGLFVAVMALDGTNALLVDLGLWHPYTPDNRLRLATGLLTGVALAAILCHLLATTLWREGRWDQAPIGSRSELALIVAIQLPFALLALSGLPSLYAPIALFLVIAAAGVLGSMMLVVVVLGWRRDRSFSSFDQLQLPITLALLLGLVVMASFAVARFLLEHLTGAPPLA